LALQKDLVWKWPVLAGERSFFDNAFRLTLKR